MTLRRPEGEKVLVDSHKNIVGRVCVGGGWAVVSDRKSLEKVNRRD